MIATASRPANAVLAYVPANLPLDVLPDKWRDYASWFCGRLYIQRHVDRRYWDGQYIPMNAQVLDQILPRRDRLAIMGLMTDVGMIESDRYYRPSTQYRRGRSMGWRLTETYRSARVRRDCLYHPELVRKLTNYRRREDRKLQPVHRHLRAKMESLEVVGQHDDSLGLQMIADSEFWFTVCAQGRVHTNLTNLRKQDRQHVRCGGQVLWITDIRNSQLLIMACIMRELHRNGQSNINLTVAQKQGETEGERDRRKKRHKRKAYVHTYSSGGQNDDFDRLVSVCEAGQFYEVLGRAVGKHRDDVKRPFMAVAYGDRSLMYRIEEGQAFRDLFPACFYFIRDSKPTMRERTAKDMNTAVGVDGGTLARYMQRQESDLVIGRVCGRIQTENPSIPLFTIHDCLATIAEYRNYCEVVFKDEFRKAYGVNLPLRSEPFSGNPVNH